jgi:hypothetical protein
MGDEVERGVDAMLTLLVLFTDGEGIFNVRLRDVLLRVDVSAIDNGLTIQDARALG